MEYFIIVLIVLVALFLIYLIIGAILLMIFNHKLFGSRTQDPDNPCYLTYEDFQDELDRKEFQTYYYVREINGYIYQKRFMNEFKGFIILSHGMFGTHIQYMMDIDFLCRNGYQVLAFDNYGCGLSEGESTQGLATGVYVLENVIEDVKANHLNHGLPIFLYGHSWGGFSVLGAMRNYPEIKGVISRSAPYSQLDAGKVLIQNIAKKIDKFYGPFVPFIGFFLTSHRMRITIKRGVEKNKKTPVLVIQSKNDPMVPYPISAACYFTNHPMDQVHVKVTEKGLHNSIIEEEGSKAYAELVKKYKEIETIPDQKKKLAEERVFLSSLNKKEMYPYNREICDFILDFLEECLKK